MWFEEVKVRKTGTYRLRKGRDGLMGITELPKCVHTAVESIPTSKGSGRHVKVGSRELLVQNRGVPGSVRSEEHMRVAIEIIVSRDSHIKVGQTFADMKRDNISLGGNKALCTSVGLGTIINDQPKTFHLTLAVDRSATIVAKGIRGEDGNHRPIVKGVKLGGGLNNGQVLKQIVGNTFNISSGGQVGLKDASVGTKETTIGAPINESAENMAGRLMYPIQLSGGGTTIDSAIHRDKILRWHSRRRSMGIGRAGLMGGHELSNEGWRRGATGCDGTGIRILQRWCMILLFRLPI